MRLLLVVLVFALCPCAADAQHRTDIIASVVPHESAVRVDYAEPPAAPVRHAEVPEAPVVTPSVLRARIAELGLDPANRALALYVARVAFNEALDNEADLAMIWNIVQARRVQTQARIDWLRAHSRCVMGAIPRRDAVLRPGNCSWTRDLMPSGQQPPGFVECRDENRDGVVDGPCHGRWQRVRARWLRHMYAAVEYVAGEREMRACPVTPTTWDGSRWRDDITARGFVDLGCKGTRNLGLVTRPAARRIAFH